MSYVAIFGGGSDPLTPLARFARMMIVIHSAHLVANCLCSSCEMIKALSVNHGMTDYTVKEIGMIVTRGLGQSHLLTLESEESNG